LSSYWQWIGGVNPFAACEQEAEHSEHYCKQIDWQILWLRDAKALSMVKITYVEFSGDEHVVDGR